MSESFRKGEWTDGQWTPSDDDDELPAAPRGADLSPEDHELLVLAARAFGADFVEVEGEGYGNLNFPDGAVIPSWNPLLFSGDSFDLGVRLDLLGESADFNASWPKSWSGSKMAKTECRQRAAHWFGLQRKSHDFVDS